jgi:hypothetical protein
MSSPEEKQKLYQGVVWEPDENSPGVRVEFLASDSVKAVEYMKATFGESAVFSVHCEDDAKKPR